MSAGTLTGSSAVVLASLVRARRVSARDVLDAHLARIARLDPQLRAFRVVLEASARAEADAIDRHRDPDDARPLLGVPVAIKDTIDVRGVSPRCVARGAGSAPQRRMRRWCDACAPRGR